jgi:hypothetical protein
VADRQHQHGSDDKRSGQFVAPSGCNVAAWVNDDRPHEQLVLSASGDFNVGIPGTTTTVPANITILLVE